MRTLKPLSWATKGTARKGGNEAQMLKVWKRLYEDLKETSWVLVCMSKEEWGWVRLIYAAMKRWIGLRHEISNEWKHIKDFLYASSFADSVPPLGPDLIPLPTVIVSFSLRYSPSLREMRPVSRSLAGCSSSRVLKRLNLEVGLSLQLDEAPGETSHGRWWGLETVKGTDMRQIYNEVLYSICK